MGIRRIIWEGLGMARGELGETNKITVMGTSQHPEIPWLIPIINAY